MNRLDFWNKIAATYATGKTSGRSYILDPAFLQTIGDVKGKRILDVACGAGEITNALARKGAICTGIDYASNSIEQARIKAKELGLKVDFRMLDARDLSELTEEFDLVVMSILFPHLEQREDIKKVIDQCAKVLRAGGRLVIGEPHPAFDFYMRNRLATEDFEYFNSGLPYDFTMDIKGNQLSSVASHWTLQDYFDAITSSFEVKKIIEPQPLEKAKQDNSAWYEDRSRYPSYIIFDCVKR